MEILNVIEKKLRDILMRTKPGSVNFDETLLNIPHIKAHYNLRIKFNINVSFSEYFTQKEQILRNYIAAITSGKV